LTVWQSCFALKTGNCGQNLHSFSGKAWELQIVILQIYNSSFSRMNKKTFCLFPLAARAVFVSQFSLY
jgi:hypothetical protein